MRFSLIYRDAIKPILIVPVMKNNYLPGSNKISTTYDKIHANWCRNSHHSLFLSL
jgi:hypothetical protein